MQSLVKTKLGQALSFLRDRGLDIRPFTDRNGRMNGIRCQWSNDDALRGSVVTFEQEGVSFSFFVNDERDEVQGCHRRGTFYEPEELDIIRGAFRGGCFVDVGCNVGNHAIYAAKMLGASKVIAFEPGDLASAILNVNIALNHLQHVVAVHKCGLSNQPGTARMISLYNSNLGSNQLVDDPEGEGGIALMRGDDVIGVDEAVDFIKIDTEGFEMQVLDGLTATLARAKPTLFVEVDNQNIDAFGRLLDRIDYRLEREFRRYGTGTNMLAVAR